MTQQHLHLVPAPGRLVRKPDGHPLHQDGELLPLSSFWQRRLRDGDVTIKTATKRATNSVTEGATQ
ncbi:DUF2635 domain-containing protein [Shewanella xiamenensis]|uniref:DUF2635 domain-containing protein n=1 Tax=Shewanella xiamenensis TaxID=332186 RepID=UPI00084981E5|nr:DUF2635 domain-containing protein [Shewanella xiamenensis]ODR86709.1 hypothetical protein ABT47_16055 [Shewanella xiamenensis]